MCQFTSCAWLVLVLAAPPHSWCPRRSALDHRWWHATARRSPSTARRPVPWSHANEAEFACSLNLKWLHMLCSLCSHKSSSFQLRRTFNLNCRKILFCLLRAKKWSRSFSVQMFFACSEKFCGHQWSAHVFVESSVNNALFDYTLLTPVDWLHYKFWTFG